MTLSLTRKKGETVYISNARKVLKLTVIGMSPGHCSLVLDGGKPFKLSPGGQPFDLGLDGATVSYVRPTTRTRVAQVMLGFNGPKSVTFLRAEVSPGVKGFCACPGCGHRVTREQLLAARFDFDCSSCQQYPLSQFEDVK